uniref:Uncharacterized protein n=1 Tax=Oryza nivara TaxID=4536 RepID=A0A0E0FG68_ORYNI
MKGDGVRRGKEEALGAGGGQLCPECGYEYPNANPNPRLRRSHSKNCRRKMKMPVVAEEAGVAVHKRRRGLAVENASRGGGGDKVVHEGSSEQGCSAKAKEISAEPKLMADDPMSSHEKHMICHRHYKLYPTKVAPQCNDLSFGPFLGLRRKAMIVTKGIKVMSGETLDYKPEGGRIMFLFEAGVVDELHASAIRDPIGIYLKDKNETICIGSITKAQPRARLWLMLSEEMKLFHNSERRSVYFNGYEFYPMYKCLHPLETYRKLWVVEVKPFEDASFNPVEDERKYYLLKVFSTAIPKEEIDVHVRSNKEVKRLGVISSYDTSFSCKLDFEDQFTLSHTSQEEDVVFYGYTLRHGAFCTYDPEYRASKALTAKREPEMTIVPYVPDTVFNRPTS